MVCERCKKKESTVHLTEIIKNIRSEVHLCEQCARDIGFNSKLSNYSLSIPDMLSFLDDGISDKEAGVCPCCGTTASDIGDSGHVGCPECYKIHSAFIAMEFPEIGNIYCGKHPIPLRGPIVNKSIENEAEAGNRDDDDLLTRLEDAIRDEQYEEAARLRDLIKEKTV